MRRTTLGYSGFPDSDNGIQDTVYNFTLPAFADSDGTLSFTFTSNSNEDLSNEFYDIDNVSVSTTDAVTPAPEPASFALLGIGLVGLIATCRRRT